MTPAEPVQAQQLLSIGAFARLTRLSLKALRLYGALGLLPPARVDPQSGYRFYAPEQAAQARLIGLLRQLDMPLNQIAEVLARPGPQAAEQVAVYWRGAEQDLASKRGLVQYLESLLSGEEHTMYPIKSREVPVQKVATVQRNVFVKDLSAFIAAAYDQLVPWVAQAGARPSGPGFVIYQGEVNEDSDGPVEVCLPFEGVLEPGGEVGVRLEAAHRELYTTLTKAQVAFPDILKAYDAVSGAVREQGLTPAAAPREVYVADWNAVADDAPACDIAWPVQEGGRP